MADYLQTVDLEVSLIWERDWSRVKVLYVISRYIPCLYLPVALFVGLQYNPTVQKCGASFATSSLLIVTGMMVAEAILFIRVCALAQSKRITIWLVLQFIGVHAAIYAVFSLFLKSIKFLPYQIGNIPGCIPYRFNSTLLLVVFGIVVASETIIMLITGYIGVRRYRSSDCPLLVVFYQDGILYFVSLAAVTVGNIIFDVAGPPELRFMLAVPQGVLHSVLSCRMILHLYDFGKKEVTPTHATGTALEFATRNGGGETTRESDLSPHDQSSSEQKTGTQSSV
ncbi:hypothetical protein H1R20_g4846, partial [Candolleomyces eurysporus]